MSSRRQRGQSLIEFALVMPLLAIVMVGAVDLTHMVYDDGIMHEVVVETGKLAMVENNGHVYTNEELLHWMRTAARAQDHSIGRMDITAGTGPGSNPWEFDGSRFDQVTGNPDHQVDPAATSQSAHTDELNAAAPGADSQKAASAPAPGCHFNLPRLPYGPETLINPGLMTIRVQYRFNAEVFGSFHAPPISYARTVTQYEFLALPIPNRGCLQDPEK